MKFIISLYGPVLLLGSAMSPEAAGLFNITWTISFMMFIFVSKGFRKWLRG